MLRQSCCCHSLVHRARGGDAPGIEFDFPERALVVGDRQRDLLEVSGGRRRVGGVARLPDGGDQPGTPGAQDGDDHGSRDQPPRRPSPWRFRPRGGYDLISSIEG